MKLTKLLLTGFLALMATAMVGCDKESSNANSIPNSDSTPSSEASAEHIHSYTQGVCECGDIQTPTIDVKGKTYIITEMLGVYDKDNAPTDEQRTLCESFVQRVSEINLGAEYVFNTDGTVSIELVSPPENVEQPAMTYVQKGDFVTVTTENQDLVLSFIGKKLYATESYADMADMFNGYAGFSMQTVLTAEEDAPHMHKYVQGECACGHIQDPTLEVTGKTFDLVKINAVYSEETPPTDEQKKLCEETVAFLSTAFNGSTCTFLAGGGILITDPLNLSQNLNTSGVSYYQAGDYITLQFNNMTLVAVIKEDALFAEQALTPELVQLIGADTVADLTGGYEHLTLQLVFSPESTAA